MARVASVTTTALAGLLRSDVGVPAAVAALAAVEPIELAAVTPAQIVPANLTVEIADRSHGARYPQLWVYCEKVTNDLREKFQKFSGKASMVVEVRVSQDRTEGLEQRLQLYVDAVTNVLEENRGEWAGGVYYSGSYEVSFGGVRQGGKNVIQIAKIGFQLDIRRG